MNHAYFDKASAFAKKAQEPLQALAELNMKTLQELDYIKLEELTQIKQPEVLLKKQIEVNIANGYKAIDYMQKSFQIMEKALWSMTRDIQEKAEAKK